MRYVYSSTYRFKYAFPPKKHKLTVNALPTYKSVSYRRGYFPRETFPFFFLYEYQGSSSNECQHIIIMIRYGWNDELVFFFLLPLPVPYYRHKTPPHAPINVYSWVSLYTTSLYGTLYIFTPLKLGRGCWVKDFYWNKTMTPTRRIISSKLFFFYTFVLRYPFFVFRSYSPPPLLGVFLFLFLLSFFFIYIPNCPYPGIRSILAKSHSLLQRGHTLLVFNQRWIQSK